MAREWETPEIKKPDSNDTWYVIYNKNAEEQAKRVFNPNDYAESDSRNGEARMFLTQDVKYLLEIYRQKQKW